MLQEIRLATTKVVVVASLHWQRSLSEPIAALPLQIFSYAISPYDDWHRQAWAGALVLVVTIFFINVLVRLLTRGRMMSPT